MMDTKRLRIITAVAALMAIGTAMWAAEDIASMTRIAQRKGRVAANLPESCALGLSRYGESALGLRWPGVGGTEFMGGGGWALRFRSEGEQEEETVSLDSFEPVETGAAGMQIGEGCEGGKRFPHPAMDDDKDGKTDEDPLDGMDNDADGLVDEDFAAAGDAMTVTRARFQSRGLSIAQYSYVWSYGHVRDFIGFTTIFSFDAPARDRLPDIMDLDIALCVDFRIGDPDDEERGRDDVYFFMGGADTSGKKEGEGTAGFVSVSGGSGESPFAALIMMDISGPDGRRGADALLADGGAAADSPWELTDPIGDRDRGDPFILLDPPGGRDSGEKELLDFFPDAEGFVETWAGAGEKTVVGRIGRIGRMKPGENVRVEWALVFGRTREALAKNVLCAVETYVGTRTDDGGICRWVVPARKAGTIGLQAKLAPIWVRGERRPAAVINLPEDFEDEVEWIRMAGEYTESYEMAGGKIIAQVDGKLIEKKEPLRIDGQLSDGTIFHATVDNEEISLFNGNDSLPPDRLPGESLKVFPNPFASTLKIDLRVYDASRFMAGRDGDQAEGSSTVRIYDVKGRLVKTILQEEFLHPGEYSMGWDGTDENGAEVSPGVYYCKLQVGERSLTRRVVLLR